MAPMWPITFFITVSGSSVMLAGTSLWFFIAVAVSLWFPKLGIGSTSLRFIMSFFSGNMMGNRFFSFTALAFFFSMTVTTGTARADRVHRGWCQDALTKEKWNGCCCRQSDQVSYFQIKHNNLLLLPGESPKAKEFFLSPNHWLNGVVANFLQVKPYCKIGPTLSSGTPGRIRTCDLLIRSPKVRHISLYYFFPTFL